MEPYHSLRKRARMEKKIKKLTALSSIMTLNDRDREQDNMAEQQEELSHEDDDGFIKVTHKKKNKMKKHRLDSCSDEPLSKKQKTDNDGNEEKVDMNVTMQEYVNIKKKVKRRPKPKFPEIQLLEVGNRALISGTEQERTPLFLTDLQHLVMLALLGQFSPCTPDRWCYLRRRDEISHTVVVCIDGLSLFHYLSNENKFKKINEIFQYKFETLMPIRGREISMVEEFAQVSFTNAQANQLINEYGSLEAAIELTKDPTLFIKGFFPVEDIPVDPANNDLHPNDKFPRTKLLLSALQMADEGYPMPLKGDLNKNFSRYVMTKDKYAPVTNRSPLFAVDCEMCQTSVGDNELTRISIVNEDCKTVYETLVMPDNKIVNFLTKYSGITEEMMMKVTKKLKDVHREVRELLPPDAILVGQSLNSDLTAMRMMHPYVIDTSVCFNLTGVRSRKSKLQKLAITFLKENIQQREGGHDSVEDSLTCLKLVKLKLANSVEFGDEILSQKKHLHDILHIVSRNQVQNNLLGHTTKRAKRTAIITTKPLPTVVQELLQKAESTVENPATTISHHEVSSNEAAALKCKEIFLQNAFTLCNLQFTSGELHASAFDATIEKIDSWISNIWEKMVHNGLMLVLMAGAPECPSGVAAISIKHCKPASRV